MMLGAVHVAKLIKQSLRHQRYTVRMQSSANFYIEHLLNVNCIEMTKIKNKRPGMALKTFDAIR